MGQVLQFPCGASVADPAPKPTSKRPAKSKLAASSVVVPIRPGRRVPRKPRPDDERVAMIQHLSRTYLRKAADLAHDPASKDYFFAVRMAGISAKLPINNLRCILSTLDEQHDFELRCAEVELAHAQHQVGKAEADRLSVLEGQPWWASTEQRALVEENNVLFEAYRVALMAMAEHPARTWPHLERKLRLIGKMWLTSRGDWYDRLRAAVAADRLWLEANRPKKRRAAK